MRYVRLGQGGAAWEAWRRGGIGSSDAAAVMGVSPWQTPRQLWEVLTGRAPPPQTTFAMRRGLRLEPVARRLYECRTGRLMEPCCVLHDRHDWLRASLDGLDLAGGVVLEIKAPDADTHRLALAGEVPAHYRPQVQHQLLVSGARLLHYASYSENRAFGPQERLALVEVAPDPGYQARLLYAEWCFWGRVVLGHWPGDEVEWEEGGTCTRSR
jgi:putative phage-type endonuclease